MNFQAGVPAEQGRKQVSSFPRWWPTCWPQRVTSHEAEAKCFVCPS